ncbi:MAG: hypothetical protein EHM59_06625 [Betaproteobacteria bacterium]|nr:MAG: hypothetical protein EHM59_06625 [Betaproteobacteria bacterium]
MSSSARFESLEQLRSRASELLAAQRCRYAGKPLPLADDERHAWEEQVALWQALYFGYAMCTDAAGEADLTALVWLRSLDSLGRAIREYARAYRAVPAALWKELNSCYRAAESCGLESTEVPVQGRAGASESCRTIYLVTVLHEAANVYALSAAQMHALERWLPDWARSIDLLPAAPAASRSPLAIDLCGDSGAQVARELGSSDTLRYLDTSVLAARLRALASSLREGTPEPELEEALRELPHAALERMLTHLYVQWCSAGTGRIDERRDTAIRAQVAVTMHAVHFQISGRAFRQPGLRYTREEEYDLATFGHITERTEQRLLTGRSSALEPWEIFNHSLSSSFGMCRKPDLQSRIGHGQLVAIRTSSAAAPMLATVQRLKMESDGSLNAGVKVIRGEVRGVAVRPAGDASQKYERALVVSDDDAKAPPTMIVPRDQFGAGALIEIYSNRGETVQLGEVVERGFDFERVTFRQD